MEEVSRHESEGDICVARADIETAVVKEGITA
jgi:hypothetical protein